MSIICVSADKGNATYLGQRAALTNNDLITESDITEARGDVHGQGLVALLETVVLLDVVKVVSSDNASPERSHGVSAG